MRFNTLIDVLSDCQTLTKIGVKQTVIDQALTEYWSLKDEWEKILNRSEQEVISIHKTQTVN